MGPVQCHSRRRGVSGSPELRTGFRHCPVVDPQRSARPLPHINRRAWNAETWDWDRTCALRNGHSRWLSTIRLVGFTAVISTRDMFRISKPSWWIAFEMRSRSAQSAIRSIQPVHDMPAHPISEHLYIIPLVTRHASSSAGRRARAASIISKY